MCLLLRNLFLWNFLFGYKKKVVKSQTIFKTDTAFAAQKPVQKFLKIHKELFIKSSLCRVRGSAPTFYYFCLLAISAAPRALFLPSGLISPARVSAIFVARGPSSS